MKRTSKFQWTVAFVMGMAMTSMMMTSCSKEDNPMDNGEVIENEYDKEELDFGDGEGASMVGAQAGYIYDAKVLGCKDSKNIKKLKKKYQNDGWEIIDQDLNKGAAGKYIYLAVKKCDVNSAEQGQAITTFYLSDEYSKSLSRNGHTYWKAGYDGDRNFDGNLNSESGGTKFYLYYERNTKDLRAVTKVYFNDNANNEENGEVVGLNGNSSGKADNVVFKGFDLNNKTTLRGKKIYMHVETNTNVPRWKLTSSGVAGCVLNGFYGDTKDIRSINIPNKFDGMDVKQAYAGDSILPNLQVQNYFISSYITHASALNYNPCFEHVNVIDNAGNVFMDDALPESIIEVARWGFKGTGIKEIALPYGLEIIGEGAFENSTKLEKINFGNADSAKFVNETRWNIVKKGPNWNTNVHANFQVAFKGIK